MLFVLTKIHLKLVCTFKIVLDILPAKKRKYRNFINNLVTEISIQSKGKCAHLS